MCGNHPIVTIKRKEDAERIIREVTPFFLLLLEKRKRAVLFCKASQRFFVMDKAIFEQVGEKYLAKNRPPKFKSLGNYFRHLCISVTSKCNMACKYCFGSEAERSGKTIDFKIAKAAIDYIAKQKKPVDVMFSSAGEGTLEPELLEKILKYIRGKPEFYWVRISTNGTMNPKIYLRLRDYFDNFQISLDGPPEIQDLQRPMKGGGKSSKRVEATLRELKKHNKKFSIKVTLTLNHIGKEERTFKYFYKLEIPKIIFSTVAEMGLGSVCYNKSKEGELSNLQLKMQELCDEFGLSSKPAASIHAFGSRESGFCPVGRSFYLGVDGGVASCIMYSDEKDLEMHPSLNKLMIGRFKREKGEFEMDNKRIKELRNVHKKALCYNCGFKFCWGGCPFRNLEYGKGKTEEPYKKLCQDRRRETEGFLKYWVERNIMKIKPCLLERESKLYYSMQFSEFKLVRCSSENIPDKSAFVVFNPAENNLKKMEKKMISATKKSKDIVLFVLSPKHSNRLNREKSNLFQRFLRSLKKNKVLFKISSPIKITAESPEEESLFYREFQIPQDCLECLEMFKLKEGRVIFCDGTKGPKIENFFNREEIFSAFQKTNISYNE